MHSPMDVMKGFTLIETLITTSILIPALTAVALLFAYSTAGNISNQQRTASTLLLSEKMEALRDAPLNTAVWNPGVYSDSVEVGADGTLALGIGSGAYSRTWQIKGMNPRTATIVVYAQRAGLTRKRMEVARATMMKAW